jgi:hypothetical protein
MDDMPETTETGTTSLWATDLTWSSDDMYLIVCFKLGSFVIFNRMGEAVNSILEMPGTRPTPRVFCNLYFTTNAERYAKHG